MTEEEKLKQRVREAFKEGYKTAEKDIPLEKVLEKTEGASA